MNETKTKSVLEVQPKISRLQVTQVIFIFQISWPTSYNVLSNHSIIVVNFNLMHSTCIIVYITSNSCVNPFMTNW